MIEKIEKRTDGGKINGDYYVYRNEDGSISHVSVVESPATSCEQCGVKDICDRGAVYTCNRCAYRGDHGIWLVPAEGAPHDEGSVRARIKAGRYWNGIRAVDG